MDVFEGGIRVPGIIQWPTVIKPNSIIDAPTSLLDFAPTINSIVVNHHQSTNVFMMYSVYFSTFSKIVSFTAATSRWDQFGFSAL